MQNVELIAVLAVIQFFFFGAMTGRARRKSGLKAPLMTGDEAFERMYRVQMNTLETLVAFLPVLLIAPKYWAPNLITVVGCIYLIGRFIYWKTYVTNPEKRGLGFMLSMISTFILIILAFLGIMKTLFN